MSDEMWKPETFLKAHPTMPVPKAGYVYRGLGLHVAVPESPKGRRPPIWTLTHLGSGHRLCQIKGKVADVFPIASEIAEAGDWTFDGLYGWKNQFPEAREKMDEWAKKYKRVTFTTNPHDMYSEKAAQDVMMQRESA